MEVGGGLDGWRGGGIIRSATREGLFLWLSFAEIIKGIGTRAQGERGGGGGVIGGGGMEGSEGTGWTKATHNPRTRRTLCAPARSVADRLSLLVSSQQPPC